MKTQLLKSSAGVGRACVLALALATIHVAVAPAQAQACLDRRQIQEAVTSGQIRSLDTVLVAAGVDPQAEILSVQVCDQNGRLSYIIGVLSTDGQAKNLVLDAQ